MTDKKRGRPRKDIRAGDIGREIIDAFFATLAEMEDAIETASRAARDPKSDDDPVRRGFMRVRELTKRFEEQTGKDFRRFSKLLLSVLQSRDDRRLADRRAELTRKAKGRTIKRYFEDGMTAEMCPMGPDIIADNEAEAKELRSRMEGLPVYVHVSGVGLIPDGKMTVNSRDLKHLYRVPVSVHLNCPDDYREEQLSVIVNFWRQIRDASGFEGVAFREKKSNPSDRQRKPDHARIADCLALLDQAAEIGKHELGTMHKPDTEDMKESVRASDTASGPDDLEYTANILREVIDAVPDEVKPDVTSAIVAILAERSADHEEGKPKSKTLPSSEY